MTDDQAARKERVEQTAQKILDVRARYPDKSLAWLYNPETMPKDLRQAHEDNDRAVMDLYGIPPDATEEQIVAELMERYQDMTEEGSTAKSIHSVVFGAGEANKAVVCCRVENGPGKYAASVCELKNDGRYGFGQADVRTEDLADVCTTFYFCKIESLEAVITALEALRDKWMEEEDDG